MKGKSASRRALTRSQGESKIKTQRRNPTILPILPRSRKGKYTTKESRTKSRTGRVVKKIPQATPATASRHCMTLRSKSTHISTNTQDAIALDSALTTVPRLAEISSQPALSTTEPVVRASSMMPEGYRFVSKGDPYVTRNCRDRTRRARQVVYAVTDDKKKPVGIRVPTLIYAAVVESAVATSDRRRLIVKKQDEDLERRFREAILARFPRIPPEELRVIIRHATVKRGGRVGRTGRIEMPEKAFLAVQAHIRHNKTDYENLLRGGTKREAARSLTAHVVFGILDEWGPVTTRRVVETERKSTSRKFTQRTRGSTTLLKSTGRITKRSKRARLVDWTAVTSMKP